MIKIPYSKTKTVFIVKLCHKKRPAQRLAEFREEGGGLGLKAEHAM